MTTEHALALAQEAGISSWDSGMIAGLLVADALIWQERSIYVSSAGWICQHLVNVGLCRSCSQSQWDVDMAWYHLMLYGVELTQGDSGIASADAEHVLENEL